MLNNGFMQHAEVLEVVVAMNSRTQISENTLGRSFKILYVSFAHLRSDLMRSPFSTPKAIVQAILVIQSAPKAYLPTLVGSQTLRRSYPDLSISVYSICSWP